MDYKINAQLAVVRHRNMSASQHTLHVVVWHFAAGLDKNLALCCYDSFVPGMGAATARISKPEVTMWVRPINANCQAEAHSHDTQEVVISQCQRLS